MYKKEENDTMTGILSPYLDCLMMVDNFCHDQLIDNSHRNYCLNFIDPNHIAHKLQMLFMQSQFAEFTKEIENNFPDVFF